MYNTMKQLIEAKFYKTKEEAQKKLDVYYAVNKLTDEEYVELTALVAEKYAEIEELSGLDTDQPEVSE